MLRVATFNTGLARLLLLGRPLMDAVPHAAARMQPIRDRLAGDADGVDVWLLQEVYGRAAVDLLSAMPGHVAFAALELGRDSGLVILARRELAPSSPRIVAFPANDWVESVVARKGAMTLDLDTPAGPMRVGNLHASYDGRGRRSVAATAPGNRARQVAIALDLLERDAGVRHLLLGGDFNASRSGEQATWQVAVDRGYVDLRETAAAFDDTGVASWDPANPLTRGRGRADNIDLMFARWRGAAPRWTARHALADRTVPLPDGSLVPLSDHHALVIEMQ